MKAKKTKQPEQNTELNQDGKGAKLAKKEKGRRKADLHSCPSPSHHRADLPMAVPKGLASPKLQW